MSGSEDLTVRVRGVVQGGRVGLEEKVPLPEGTPVLVTIRSTLVGTPQAVLDALAEDPQVDAEYSGAFSAAHQCGAPLTANQILDQ